MTIETLPQPSHRGIIERAGGSTALGAKIEVDPNTVKAWKRTDSIPAGYWRVLVDEGLASFRELADYAEQRVRAG